MTSPSPDTLEREQDKLWLTDAELIRRLGRDLAAKQERLGPEFEQVLFDNLWGLYAR